MNFFSKNLEFVNILKIIIFSLVIFFWDLRIENLDLRLLIIILPLLSFLEKPAVLTSRYKNSFFYSCFIFILIAIHYYFNLIFDNENLIFFPKNIFYLFICFFAVLLNLDLIRNNLKSIILFFITCFVISTIIYFSQNGYNYKFSMSCTYLGGWHGYTRFLFSENSHLAMTSVAIIVFYLLGNNFRKAISAENILFLLFLIIAFINYTATFLVGLILSLCALYISNYRIFTKKKIILVIFLLFSSGFLIFSDKECSSKIFKSQSSILGLEKNLGLSGAVFVNSLNIAKSTLGDRPFGWGFNRYEHAYKKYAIDEKNKFKLRSYHRKQFEWHLNTKDGSNNFAKLVTEFGIFSFILFIYFIYFSFSRKPTFQEKSFLIPLVLTQLLRGAGYFNGGFLLCIVLMLGITFKKNND